MSLKNYLPFLWLALLPAVSWSQTDTTAVPADLRSGFEKLIRMADEAQRFYDESLAPRPPGAVVPISGHPAWELFAPETESKPPSLQAKIVDSRAGSVELELPAAVYYQERSLSGEFRLDSLPPVKWARRQSSQALYSSRSRGPVKLSCRVDCVGGVINYRFDLENTGEDSLFNLQILVPVGLEGLPAFCDVNPKPDNAGSQINSDGILRRLYLFFSGSWRSAAGALQTTGLDKPLFLPFGPGGGKCGPLAEILGGNRNRMAGVSLQGNTVYLLSGDRRWRLDVSASPAMSFCCEFSPLKLYVNPGTAVLAPEQKTSIGGIITLSPAN